MAIISISFPVKTPIQFGIFMPWKFPHELYRKLCEFIVMEIYNLLSEDRYVYLEHSRTQSYHPHFADFI